MHGGDMMNGGGMDQMNMMNMLMNAMESKGWGKEEKDDKHWSQMNMNSPEDMAAFQKWCEERENTKKEYEYKQHLMEMYEKQEKERKEKMEMEMKEKAEKEKHEAMMAKWSSWQEQLKQVQNFDKIEYKMMEMNHMYMYAVTAEIMKFCKCEDWIDDLGKYFSHAGFSSDADKYDMDYLENIDWTNVQATAQALYQRPAEDLVAVFYGGLSWNLCEGAKKYLGDVVQWDKDTGFMSKLM